MCPPAIRRLGALLFALALLGSLTVSHALAASITVNSLTDLAANDGACTLREAIIAANTHAASGASAGECPAGSATGTNSITFSASGTINLGADLPDITSNLDIDAGNHIVVDGGGTHSAFNITSGTVGLAQLTVQNALNVAGGSGISNVGSLTVSGITVTANSSPDSGGGIANSGTLIINNSVISNNSSAVGLGGQGGGVFNNNGTVTINNSSITGNTADGGAGVASLGGIVTIHNSVIGSNTAGVIGGGISNSNGTITILNSSLGSNASGTAGGGIYLNGGTIKVGSSTFGSNAAGTAGGGIAINAGTANIGSTAFGSNSAVTNGGGIYLSSSGSMTLSNNAIVLNTAAQGGGIDASGTVIINNVTITNNTAIGVGGGIANHSPQILVNSIVAGNIASAGQDVAAANSGDTLTGSLVGIPSGHTLGDIFVLDSGGHPLFVNNGGPTNTVALALVAGNPAIDHGNAAICAAPPVNAIDQRGFPRPSACDIGSYEAQPPTIGPHANVSVAVSPPAPTVVTYTSPAGTDEQGGVAGVACLPASGSTFAVGSTTVTCTATDAVGHTASGTFAVIVSAIAAPSPPAPSLPNSATAAETASPPGAQTMIGIVVVLLAFLSLIVLVVLGRIRARAGMGSD